MGSPLLDIVAASEARDAAIGRVSAAASPSFILAASTAVILLAGERQFLTTDDVWVELERVGQTVAEPRALGAVMRDMQAKRIILPTPRYEPSKRIACHRRPIRVWRSLIV